MEPEVEPGQSAAGFQLRDLVAILQMQWRVVAYCTAAAAILALVHGLLASSQYRSTVVIHLSSAAGQEMKSDRVVDLDQFNRWNRQVFVQTQLEILRSRKLLQRVLDAYRVREPGSPMGDAIVACYPTDPPGAELDAEGSPTGPEMAELSSSMEIDPRQGTELLDLSVTSDHPGRACVLANLVARTYQDYNLETMKESATAAQGWLEDKILDYRGRIEAASRELVRYQKENDLADVEETTNSRNVRMDSLNQAYADVHTQRVMLESRVWSHERLLTEGNFRELAKDLDTTLVASLTEDYAAAVTEQAQIAARYGEKMPERRAADARLLRIEQELKSEVELTLSAERKKLRELYSQEKNLEEELSLGKQQMLDVSSQRPDYEKLKLDLERSKAFFVRLNERKDELELQSKTQLNNVRIVDSAIAVPKRVSPTVPLNLAIALIGGFVLGMGLGLAREYLDDTISSPLEVQTFLRVPFLGMIPKIAEETDETALALHTHRNPRSTVSEALRAIRTVIELDPRGVAPKRLLVTSAVSAEGKTSTVVRLGVAFANLDKKVVMIDADLRRPRLHKIFGVEKDKGFSSLIGGASIDSVVRRSEVPNLDFIPSGPGGERPNELLASPATEAVLKELGTRYDLILIDSPPTVLVSDARILSRQVDGVVVLVREDKTSRNLVREALTGLEQVHARVLGVIVNAVDLSNRRTSYKYAYGYGYGYRYDRYYGEPSGDDEPKPPTPG
ncbi:MAG: polysaccharide biosynthesis tyrosine autokinase [Myxococcota bacterium]